MRKIGRLLFSLPIVLLALYSCKGTEKPIPVQPSVILKESTITPQTLSFSVATENAVSCAYYYSDKEEEVSSITAEEILARGTLLTTPKLQNITLSELSPETKYYITAAAKSKTDNVAKVASPLAMTTGKETLELTVILTEGAVTENSISFTVIPMNAEACAYLCIEEPADGEIPTFTSEQIFSEGTTLSKPEVQLVTVKDLTPGTSYVITAAVKKGGANAVVEKPLVMATESGGSGLKMEVKISDVETTDNSITFTVTTANAGKAAWDVERITEDYRERDAHFIIYSGKEIEGHNTPKTFTKDDLVDDAEYIIYAAVQSGDGMYNYEMEKLRVRTKKRPGPTELTPQVLTEGKLKGVLRGRQYTVELANSEYTITLDFNGEEAEKNAYRPAIETGVYTHSKTNSNPYIPWTIDFLSKVVHKTDGALKLEKGELTIKQNGSKYDFEGYFITEKNEMFRYEYNGEIPYPIDRMNSGAIEETDNGYKMKLLGDIHNLELIFDSKGDIVGEHAVGENIAKTSAIVVAASDSRYNIESGTLKIEEPYEDRLDITGSVTLNNGDKVNINIAKVNVNIPDPVVPEVITFTKVLKCQSWEEGEDMWGMIGYHVELADASGATAFHFDIGNLYGSLNSLATGKYFYSSDSPEISDGGVGWIKLIEAGVDVSRDTEDGEVIISKEGTTYTIEVKMSLRGGKEFKGKYVGPVECVSLP